MTDMDKIGTITMSEMGTSPFYSVYWRGRELEMKDNVLCAETAGDCFKFVSKYLKMVAYVVEGITDRNPVWTYTPFEVH